MSDIVDRLIRTIWRYSAGSSAANDLMGEAAAEIASLRLAVSHTFDTQIELVEKWAADRGILSHSTAQAQLLKTMSELGELADATIKGRPDDVVDGIGDVLVTLVIYAKLQGVTLGGCLASAYDQIKDRRGRMVAGGAFVKEGDE